MTYSPIFKNSERFGRDLSLLLPNTIGRKILYTYIRKNACTVFKNYVVESCGLPSFEPKKFDVLEALIVRRQDQYPECDISIFVYRDPMARAISTFVNKFIDQRGATDILASYETLTGVEASRASFLDVLQYLTHGFDAIDPHFWPQKEHLLPIAYTHPIEINDLSATMTSILQDDEHVGLFATRPNSSEYGNMIGGDLSERPASELSALKESGARFSPLNFDSPRTMEIVGSLYAMDYAMIEEIT